ncbi:plasma-membrane proton-efflux P-type ATPase [Aureibacter tunicatorum]|uniref:H+-transporting ATPase n=1 Tax=Aureibacter tunicatorum TaxID=866807 RepID=A0AAE3XSG9_9BACT|nr:plasma-membrane proton-efflux P-type ATPase [Aureibacter tunicatorum]MDR6241700.1 H+-transporting ATPase [Aureibacter tunicatorum]BDD07315.1 plasma-membrane proton-efflux P-type ATPase [Aureibacter tunicatorum]
MKERKITVHDAKSMSVDELEKLFSTSEKIGLNEHEASQRREKYGPNKITEEKHSKLLIFLSFFIGPIPFTIEIAAVLSAVVQHWNDLIVILILLVFNAVIGYWQRSKADQAIGALKNQLALKAMALRDGQWKSLDADQLVPGDIIRIQMGDIIPADVKLVKGDFLSVDQSAMTGESLVVHKKISDVAYSGSVAKKGNMKALVFATGTHTYFGKTAELVQSAKKKSHFNQAIFNIAKALVVISIILAIVLIVFMTLNHESFLTVVQFALILVVASIPVAMPAVLTVIMANGASVLAKKGIVVSHLESIEEMAGMNVLCTDKTGTLTQNRLSFGESYVHDAKDEQELFFSAALASEVDTKDPIDSLIVSKYRDDKNFLTMKSMEVKFSPFDPIVKESISKIVENNEDPKEFVKGAPQKVLEGLKLDDEIKEEAIQRVEQFANKGLRTLAIAIRKKNEDIFLGLVSLTDTLREDTIDTISRARQMGIDVKMITGDNISIAKEIGEKVHLGKNVLHATEAFEGIKNANQQVPYYLEEKIENADIFAEVLPEHKFDVVKILQNRGHIVGMTGDGVNDAPALKQADTGIAVEGATDAARSAAGVVLMTEGLKVIIDALEESRKIFEKMNSYAMYRITETIRIMGFVVISMMALKVYPITAIMIILLALFNDVPILTLASDNVIASKKPVRWDIRRLVKFSSFFGVYGIIETCLALYIAHFHFKLSTAELQTFVFLKLSIAGHLTLFVTRTKRFFLKSPFPSQALIWSAVSTKLMVTALAVIGFGLLTPVSWQIAVFVWVYCIAGIFLLEFLKLYLLSREKQKRS